MMASCHLHDDEHPLDSSIRQHASSDDQDYEIHNSSSRQNVLEGVPQDPPQKKEVDYIIQRNVQCEDPKNECANQPCCLDIEKEDVYQRTSPIKDNEIKDGANDDENLEASSSFEKYSSEYLDWKDNHRHMDSQTILSYKIKRPINRIQVNCQYEDDNNVELQSKASHPSSPMSCSDHIAPHDDSSGDESDSSYSF